MLSAAEIARGTRGALGFLQNDPAAPFQFENTIESCLRSFRVIGLTAPVYALYLALFYSSVATTADTMEILAVEAVRYVVDWLFYPVIFYEIARRRGWLDRFPRYIAALNWINFPALILAALALGVSLMAPPTLAIVIDLGLRGVFLYWFVMAARLTLEIGWPLSVLLFVVNYVPSMFLSLIVHRLLGVTAMVGG